MQAGLLELAGGCGLLTLFAALMERRRARRRFTHGPGWMPWPMLVLTGAFGGLVLLAYGLAA